MKRIVKSLGLVLLIHVLAIYLSYLIFTLLNLDYYFLFNQDLVFAFSIHAMSIGFLYALIRWFLGKWYKDANLYPYQSRFLLAYLFIPYAIVFVAENQGLSYWEYFFWFDYPLGVFFKTVNAQTFDFNLKLMLMLGMSSQALFLGMADAFDHLTKRNKKKSLKTSLTK